MPKKTCTPCLSKGIKDAIARVVKDHTLQQLLADMPECDPGVEMQLCWKPRRRSAYQEFASQCLKAKNIKKFGEAGKAMKECSIEWRRRKGK